MGTGVFWKFENVYVPVKGGSVTFIPPEAEGGVGGIADDAAVDLVLGVVAVILHVMFGCGSCSVDTVGSSCSVLIAVCLVLVVDDVGAIDGNVSCGVNLDLGMVADDLGGGVRFVVVVVCISPLVVKGTAV